LLAAGLKVSWFATEEEDAVIVRVTAGDDRLCKQAELIAPFYVRSQVTASHLAAHCVAHSTPLDSSTPIPRVQDKYRDNYVSENENFLEFRAEDKSVFSNAFNKGHFRFCSLERIRLVNSIMFKPNDENGADLGGLMREDPELILDMYPMHDREEIAYLEAIWFDGQGTRTAGRWPWFVPEKEVRDYFGEKIALYTIFAGACVL